MTLMASARMTALSREDPRIGTSLNRKVCVVIDKVVRATVEKLVQRRYGLFIGRSHEHPLVFPETVSRGAEVEGAR